MQAYFDEEIKPSSFAEGFYELNFYGNNFNCIFSDKTYNEFKTDKLQDLSIIKQGLLIRNASGILIKGGEPLLQRQALLSIFSFCKKNNIKTAIKTNLSKPLILKSLLKSNMIDIVIADIITDKKDFKNITRAGTFFESADQIYSDILKSIKILKKYDKEAEIIFQTEIVPGYVFRKETLLEIADLIKNINCSWQLKTYVPISNSMLKNVTPVSQDFIDNLKEIIKNNCPNIVVNQ